MDKKLAYKLEGYGELTLEHEYYGRGTSKSVPALIGSQNEFINSVTGMFDELIEYALSCKTEEEKKAFREEYDELNLDSLGRLRVDNMGDSTIFY